jgi:hypothetical protein
MSCDPSGLYVAMAVVGGGSGSVGRIDLYEVGTGLYAGGVLSSPVRSLAFASDASALATASDDGSVAVWQFDGTMQQSTCLGVCTFELVLTLVADVAGVLAAMASEPQFWTNYPIYLSNSAPVFSPSAAGPSQPYVLLCVLCGYAHHQFAQIRNRLCT